MDDTKQDGSEVLETTEKADAEAAQETTEVQEEKVELTKAEADELRRKAAERDELEKKNKQLFERAKKKESQELPAAMDIRDVRALQDVHDDDIDLVTKYAKDNKLGIAEAKAFLKPILDTRSEERTTASATQTRSGRGTSKVSGADLLAKAQSTGEVPDTDEGMQALFQARIQQKLGKK